MRDGQRWNLNVYYHCVFLDVVPASASRVLDVGCGDGVLSFDLADREVEVVWRAPGDLTR